MTEPKTEAASDPPADPAEVPEAAPAEVEVSEGEAQREALEIAEQLAQMERKPPLYRVFRGTMYTLYLVVAVWVVMAIAVASWRGIWGEAGDVIKRSQNEAHPVSVTGQPAN